MLLCKDCRWVEPPSEVLPLSSLADCLHPKAQGKPRVSVVTGETKPSYESCMTFRSASYPCGPDAVLFEAKEG
jgi:hypothetical protein